jgi:general secretion pathway protein F
MLKARVPIVNSLLAACSVMRNKHIRRLVEESIDSIRDGKSLARALEGRPGFTAAAMRLIAVGESTGKLDQMLLRIAMLYEQQCERRIDRFMSLLTPALTLGIAALIGAIILGVMNAIMAVNDVVIR